MVNLTFSQKKSFCSVAMQWQCIREADSYEALVFLDDVISMVGLVLQNLNLPVHGLSCGVWLRLGVGLSVNVTRIIMVSTRPGPGVGAGGSLGGSPRGRSGGRSRGRFWGHPRRRDGGPHGCLPSRRAWWLSRRLSRWRHWWLSGWGAGWLPGRLVQAWRPDFCQQLWTFTVATFRFLPTLNISKNPVRWLNVSTCAFWIQNVVHGPSPAFLLCFRFRLLSCECWELLQVSEGRQWRRDVADCRVVIGVVRLVLPWRCLIWDSRGLGILILTHVIAMDRDRRSFAVAACASGTKEFLSHLLILFSQDKHTFSGSK